MFPAKGDGLLHEHRVTSEHVISYLKANKVSKSEGTGKVERAYHLCADAVDQNYQN